MLKLAASIRQFSQRTRSRRKLPFPFAANLHIAQISALTRPFESAQCFASEGWRDMQPFRPRVLVGSNSDLTLLSQMLKQDEMDLSSVDHAIFVLTHCGSHPLTDVQRVSLWQTFGVPLYELFVGAGGAVLASECEAHDGWHVEAKTRFYVESDTLFFDSPARDKVATGLTATLNTDTCPCGREGTRLMDVNLHQPHPARRELAASA